MRAYLVVTGAIFALLALLHVWRIVADWRGFDSGLAFVAVTALIAAGLSYWAWRLFASLARQE